MGSIPGWARDEKLGKPSVTVETMGLDILLWISRRRNHLIRLEKIINITGSLPRPLIMTLCSLQSEDRAERTKDNA